MDFLSSTKTSSSMSAILHKQKWTRLCKRKKKIGRVRKVTNLEIIQVMKVKWNSSKKRPNQKLDNQQTKSAKSKTILFSYS